MLLASGAIGEWFFASDGEIAVFPKVDMKDAAQAILGVLGEDFEGFGALECGDGGDDGSDDAVGFAGLAMFWIEVLREEASEARALWWEEGGDLSMCADTSAVDPRFSIVKTGFIEEVACFHIVGAIEDKIGALDDLVDVVLIEVDGEGFGGDRVIDLCDTFGSSESFGHFCAGLGFIVEGLALEVAPRQDIAVDQEKAANACACEGFGLVTAECAASDDSDGGLLESDLTV